MENIEKQLTTLNRQVRNNRLFLFMGLGSLLFGNLYLYRVHHPDHFLSDTKVSWMYHHPMKPVKQDNSCPLGPPPSNKEN